MNRNCKNCGAVLKKRHQKRFCSNKCQTKYKHDLFIFRWKTEMFSGSAGISVKTMSKHIRNYFINKYGEECSLCGWHEKNPVTEKVPLEIDHIDGNAENNKESNLRLLCPNCHSLTPFFRNLNRGRGRKWRMDKYIKEVVKQ